MQDYKKLQDLNLKEVSANTQIEMVFFTALLEKDFKTLSRFNVKGFVKILEREYELDFTEFNEEYENYLSENQPDSLHITKTVTPPLASYSHKGSTLPFVVVILLVLVFGAGIYYFDTFKELIKSDENISNVVSLDVVKETELNLQSLENSVVVVGEENASQKEINASVEENLEEKQEVKDDNTSVKTTPLANTSETNQTSQDANLETQKVLKEVAIFKLNSKVWVGLIDLKSGKKTSFVKDSDFNVSLKEDQLILTGPTAFVVSDEEGKEKSYPLGISKRFLIQDGKITSIDLAEFKRLNNNKEW